MTYADNPLLWLVKNQDRYYGINARRDRGENVASFEKEFVATYDKRKRLVLAA